MDEPTSGLDGQSSFLIVSFLRKLAAAGQAVLCTIHQPSASLFAQFDNLLLMKAGGNMVYFGQVDQLSDYFEKNGVDMPKDINPAERMIDIVSGDLSKDKDWADVWNKSEEAKERLKETDELMQAKGDSQENEDDKWEYASTTGMQLKLVTKRASIQLWRDTEYVTNKVSIRSQARNQRGMDFLSCSFPPHPPRHQFSATSSPPSPSLFACLSQVALHIGSALFNGFSFWMIGNSYADLQNRLFTIFQFIFVARE